jgi:hypothetical protein
LLCGRVKRVALLLCVLSTLVTTPEFVAAFVCFISLEVAAAEASSQTRRTYELPSGDAAIFGGQPKFEDSGYIRVAGG